MGEDEAHLEYAAKPASEPHTPYQYEVRFEYKGKKTKTYIWWQRQLDDPKDGMRDVLVDPSGRRYRVTKLVKQAKPDYIDRMGKRGVVFAELIRGNGGPH
jgi:hypothetical protein